MTKFVQVFIGVIMLAMLFSCQVHAQNATTVGPMSNQTSAGATYNMTTSVVGAVGNTTTVMGAGLSLQSSAFTLLIPVILAGSVLHGRF